MDPRPARVRPTASARRRRARIASPEPAHMPSDSPESEHDDMPARGEDDESVGPCPGGPEDESVLISFRTHIAASIWRQQVLFICYSIIFCLLMFYKVVVIIHLYYRNGLH